MMEKILPPGVEHAEKADVSAEVFRIGGNLQQTCGTGAEQQSVNNLLVVECQRRQLMGKCEDHMHVGDRQKFCIASGQPLVASVGLAFRAMAVAAGIVGDGRGVAAASTSIPVTAERCRAAAFDGGEHFQVQSCQP